MRVHFTDPNTGIAIGFDGFDDIRSRERLTLEVSTDGLHHFVQDAGRRIGDRESRRFPAGAPSRQHMSPCMSATAIEIEQLLFRHGAIPRPARQTGMH